MALRNPWYLLCGLLLTAFFPLPTRLHSQTPAAKLLQDIRSATDETNVPQKLHDLWQLDSNLTYLVAAEVHGYYERQVPARTRAQADTLLRIYAIGQSNDPSGPQPWLLRKALFAQAQAQFYGRLVLRWSIEAISAAPETVPSYLVTEAAHTLARDYKANLITLNNAAKYWAVIDRTIVRRQLHTGTEAKEWAKVQSHIRLEMRSSMPDCNQLHGSFAEGLETERLNAEGCETFLILYSLQGCDAQSLWDKALGVALKDSKNAWLYRLAAGEAFNSRKFEKSREFWQEAFALESNVALRAHDQLQLAMAFRAEKEYRQARAHIQEAMHLLPGWGEPYVQLMNLYLEGSDACVMTEFERKAMFWLLIDLCQTLKSSDPSYADVADERYYLYLQQCPTTEEASFQGWKSGDSYPIKCWMSTATRVK